MSLELLLIGLATSIGMALFSLMMLALGWLEELLHGRRVTLRLRALGRK